MGRAIVREPRVFLMDEPVASLDAKLRVQTRTQIAVLQRRLGTTTVYITHDQVEAMTMGDHRAVLKDSVLQQVDTPKEVFAHSANTFVASFIGSSAMNLFEVPLTADGAQLGGLTMPLTHAELCAAATEGVTRITLGVRPEEIQVLSPEDLETPALDMVVDTVEDTGAVAYLHSTAKLGQDLTPVVVRLPGRPTQGKGSSFRVAVRDDAVHWFLPGTGLRLPTDTGPVRADVQVADAEQTVPTG